MTMRLLLSSYSISRAWTVKGGEMGDFGGGSVEPPRRWVGARWPGLTLGVPVRAAQSRHAPGAP